MDATAGLAVEVYGAARRDAPTLVLMPFLGGTAREWDEVVGLLAADLQLVAIDLPGFGGSAGVAGYTVAEMADSVAAALEPLQLASYVLVGHSMAGKVSAVLARRAQDARDDRLAGLVLVAPSPPGPEPMTEEKRHQMLGLLGERHADDLGRATSYINKNETRDLPPAVEARAAREVLRMNRTAWVAWLQHGSREDWAERVGVLELPAMVVAGEKDGSLGPEVQARVTMPHLRLGELHAVEGSNHLIPMERPDELAGLLREFCARIAVLPSPVPREYLEFIAGERVAPNTREVLAARIAGPAPADGVLTFAQQATLRVLLARVVPQPGTIDQQIDLAGFVMARLASGTGDGWRYDVLPADAQAWREGLDRLRAEGFDEMDGPGQDKLLTKMAAEKDTTAARWFEDVRVEATSAYVAHPATLARLGYSGFGVGGAHTPDRGFVQLGMNSPEPWEPAPYLSRPEVVR